MAINLNGNAESTFLSDVDIGGGNIELNIDGRGTFLGRVSAGTSANPVGNNNFGLSVYNDSTDASGNAAIFASNAGGGRLLDLRAGNNAMVLIENDGTATLDGHVNSKNTPGAWVNFAGNGAVGNQNIRTSHNISSVQKTATGRYTINFTRAFSSADVCVQLTSNQYMAWIDSQGASSIDISTGNENGTRTDTSIINAVVYGDY